MTQAEYTFDDTTVIVTGGTSGIGREVARRFGAAGATVINADVTAEPKDAETPTHEAIEDAGGQAEYVETDVSDREQLRSVIEAAREFGGVDVMVNNAAIQTPGPFLETSPDQLAAMLNVNVAGVFFGTQVAAKDMLDRGVGGTIINTSSISANQAQHNQLHYDASKGAVRMITRGAALALAEDGIRVNAVAPGQIATEFVEGWSETARRAAREDTLIKPVPLGRAGTSEDVAGAYLFLASEDAAYITGESIQVDGGWQVL
ncbi:MAG: SDR family oxidoreductase [Halobacteriales archaeon]|nr:SDR family oxidoreductase [Halobacteriales archaeon]